MEFMKCLIHSLVQYRAVFHPFICIAIECCLGKIIKDEIQNGSFSVAMDWEGFFCVILNLTDTISESQNVLVTLFGVNG